VTAHCCRLAADTLGLVFWLGGDRVNSRGEACRPAGEVLIGWVDIRRDAAVFVVSGKNDALGLQRLGPTLFPGRLCLAIRFRLHDIRSQVTLRSARYITVWTRSLSEFVAAIL